VAQVTGERCAKKYFSWPVVTGFYGYRGANNYAISGGVDG